MTKQNSFYPQTTASRADFTGYGPAGLLARPLSYEDAWHVFNDIHAQRVNPTPVLTQHTRALLHRALAEVLRARKAGVDGTHGAPVDDAPEAVALACEPCNGSGHTAGDGRKCEKCGGRGFYRNPKVPAPDPFALDGEIRRERVATSVDPFALSAGGGDGDPFAV